MFLPWEKGRKHQVFFGFSEGLSFILYLEIGLKSPPRSIQELENTLRNRFVFSTCPPRYGVKPHIWPTSRCLETNGAEVWAERYRELHQGGVGLEPIDWVDPLAVDDGPSFEGKRHVAMFIVFSIGSPLVDETQPRIAWWVNWWRP